jgi:hypothetical protein
LPACRTSHDSHAASTARHHAVQLSIRIRTREKNRPAFVTPTAFRGAQKSAMRYLALHDPVWRTASVPLSCIEFITVPTRMTAVKFFGQGPETGFRTYGKSGISINGITVGQTQSATRLRDRYSLGPCCRLNPAQSAGGQHHRR